MSGGGSFEGILCQVFVGVGCLKEVVWGWVHEGRFFKDLLSLLVPIRSIVLRKRTILFIAKKSLCVCIK